MSRKLREFWCDECGGLALVGGAGAVAALVGVDPRTIRNWCGAG